MVYLLLALLFAICGFLHWKVDQLQKYVVALTVQILIQNAFIQSIVNTKPVKEENKEETI